MKQQITKKWERRKRSRSWKIIKEREGEKQTDSRNGNEIKNMEVKSEKKKKLA
jgi:hypothetical protein